MENKTGKYFKYALGEILLVVIGILIALQVNNWNERRKLSITIDNMFSAFETELEANIMESNGLIRRGYFRDSISTRYINNEFAREDLLKMPNFFLGFRTMTSQFIDDNLDALIDQERELPTKFLELIPELRKLKRRIESQRKWENVVIEISMARRKELADQLPSLYLNDSISIEKNIDFILSNPLYKNKIKHFNNYDFNENTYDASLIRSSAVALLWKIKTIRGVVNTSLTDYLKSMGLKPFSEINCGETLTEIKEYTTARANFIFYNNSNKEVNYNIIDIKGNVLFNLNLAPKSFNLNEFSIPANWFVQVLENDACKKVYRRIKQDYLIVN